MFFKKILSLFFLNRNFLFRNKKGITPVIAILLLLVIAILGIFTLKSWFLTQTSSLLVDVETQGSQNNLKTEITSVVGSNIFFKNGHSTILIQDVEVDGKSCGIFGSYTEGVSTINVGNCTQNTTSNFVEIIFYTNKGIYNKQLNLIKPTPNIVEIPSISTFISVWNTSANSSGSSNKTQISLPLEGGSGTYNFFVDWGDGSNDTIISNVDPARTHNYASEGVYEIRITGTIRGFRFANGGDKLKLGEIKAWGPFQLTNSGFNFWGCSNVYFSGTDTLNLSGTTTLSHLFWSATSFTGDLSSWNTSSITDMTYIFTDASSFTSDLSSWDVSKVTDMRYAFNGATSFTSDLSSWGVSKVTDFSGFLAGTSFTGDLSNWNVSSATDMGGMFFGLTSFTSDLSSWDVSKVTNFAQFLYQTSSFTSDLSSWNMSSATNINQMFNGATSFTSDLSSWDVSNVINMIYLFRSNTFNGNISTWNTSSVKNMNQVFRDNSAFNQDISSWDTHNVTDMGNMFSGASSFNQNLSSWNVSKVTTCTGFGSGFPLPNFVSCTI